MVEGTFDVGHDKNEALSLRAQAVQHRCKHYEGLLATTAATAIEQLLAVHAAVSPSWERGVVGRGVTKECVLDFWSNERRREFQQCFQQADGSTVPQSR